MKDKFPEMTFSLSVAIEFLDFNNILTTMKKDVVLDLS